jgi:hypothetical protein
MRKLSTGYSHVIHRRYRAWNIFMCLVLLLLVVQTVYRWAGWFFSP